MSDKYILNEQGEPVSCTNLFEWATWFEDHRNSRIVKQEQVGEFWVSTVFLALDHSFHSDTPILWETMVFRQKDRDARQRYQGDMINSPPMPEQEMDRCGGSREQALAMHARMIEKLNVNA